MGNVDRKKISITWNSCMYLMIFSSNLATVHLAIMYVFTVWTCGATFRHSCGISIYYKFQKRRGRINCMKIRPIFQ